MAILMKRLSISLNSSKEQHLPRKIRPYFLRVVAELLSEGFSIHQSLQFLHILLPKYNLAIQAIESKLTKGESFESALSQLGYSMAVVAQIFYAQRQGRFLEALFQISDQLDQENAYRQKFIKILIYPTILGMFLIGMLLGMRAFILPHLVSFIDPETYANNIQVQLLINFFAYLPQIFLVGLAVLLIIWGLADYYLLRKTAIERFNNLVKIPIVKGWSRQYATYKLTSELAYFFKGGYSLQQVMQTLIKYPIDPFLSEVAGIIHQEMTRGEELTQIIKDLHIFTVELPFIIYQGEITSQLSQKCKLYSEKIFQDMMKDIEQKLSYVQPILFILIGFLVLAMYLMLMLPMLTMDGI